MSFVDSLRMSGIYPSGSGTTFGPPIESSPNFDAIARIMNMPQGIMQQNRNAEWEHQNQLLDQQHKDRLAQIAMGLGQQKNEELNQPQNVVMAPSSISPLDKAKLDLQNKDLQRKTKADQNNLDIKQQGATTKQQQADTASYRADTYHAIMDRKDLTDSQKLELMNKARLAITNAQQAGANQRNAATNQTRTDITKTTETGKNTRQVVGETNRQKDIASRGEEARETKAAEGTPNSGINLPSQQNRDQMNKAREIKQDPTLGQFINIDDKGNFSMIPPGTSFFGSPTGPTQDQFQKIHDHIYGSGDVNAKTPQKKAPESPDPKYKYVPKPGGGYTAVPVDETSDNSSGGGYSVADSTGIK